MRWHQKGPAKVLGLLFFLLFAGIYLAAGEGFEPSLTDPESVPPRYTARRREIPGDKTAFLWEI
jgi:hypothetical protein